MRPEPIDAPTCGGVELLNLAHTKALRHARWFVPQGKYFVDADALRRARQGVPEGEFHHH